MTPAEFQTYVTDAAAAAEAVLPLVGQADLDPLVAASAALIIQISNVVAARANPGDAVIAASMAAARAAADLLEAKKLSSLPPSAA